MTSVAALAASSRYLGLVTADVQLPMDPDDLVLFWVRGNFILSGSAAMLRRAAMDRVGCFNGAVTPAEDWKEIIVTRVVKRSATSSDSSGEAMVVALLDGGARGAR